MTLTLAVIVASLAVYSWKYIGFSVPKSILRNSRVSRIAGLLTVALLSALIGVQGLTTDSEIVFDARVPALLVAATLLYFRAPFIVMVAAAAAVAALIRLWF